jgi:arginyl-tRNA synthetase
MLDAIKSDLASLKISHDVFFSELSLYEFDDNKESYITKSVSYLKDQGLIYNGKLPAPKGEEDPDWEDREQLLFKSSEFGDDLDRSLSKSDGSYTYFAGDIAYAKSKIDRGFKRNLIVLGADHVGYVKRLKAVYKSLSKGDAYADVILCQLVNFIEDGKPVKMSKRAGSFTTVADVIREVGPDILRFTMLTRKNDAILDFDLDLVKSQSKENPVFYVQYAQVRALSVIKNAKENHSEIYNNFEIGNYDLSKVNSKFELEIIRDLSLFPKIIESISNTGEVHKICYYLQSIASNFHSFWNLGKENQDFKFVSDDNELSSARLALVSSVARVIRSGLELIGVEPLNKM